MLVSNLDGQDGSVIPARGPAKGGPAVRGPAVPTEARLGDVWRAVTPIWAVLATGRVIYYALERIRYPHDVPPVVADVVEALLLWPLAVLGCYLTIRAWRGSGAFRAALVALCSSLIF